MDGEWRTWCRLCGKIEVSDDSASNLPNEQIQILKKLFPIELYIDEDFPVIVCAECQKFTIKLESFFMQCVKVDRMFTQLAMVRKNETNKEIKNIRHEFGIDFDNFEYELAAIDNVHNKSEHGSININYLEDPIKSIKGVAVQKSRRRRTRLSNSKVGKKSTRQFSGFKKKGGGREEQTTSVLNEAAIEIKCEKQNPGEDDRNYTLVCPVCSKYFRKTHLRNTHLKKVHTDIARPFKCNICPKSFLRGRNLKLHSATHLPDNEKMLHKCPYCDKTFSRLENARAHIKHIHVAQRNFMCEECGKSYITKAGLKEHCLTHIDERPFQCLTCLKTFKNFQKMKIHEGTHSGNPVECKICNKKLNTKKTLHEHMVVHSDAKNYKCHICGYEFKRKPTLTKHLTTHTGKPSTSSI